MANAKGGRPSRPKQEVKEVQAVALKPQKRVVDREDWVTVMNYTTGRVLYTSKKTGFELVFTDFGQTEEIQVAELVTMKNAHPRYLNDPWIIILDEEVAEFLGLKRIYETILSADELQGFFDMPVARMEEILVKAPEGLKQTIVSMAINRIEKGQLDSLSTIRMLEKVCKVELQV